MSRFWNFVAAIAHHMAKRADKAARELKSDTQHAIDRSDWWSDVQAWADGYEEWSTLRDLRKKRLQRMAGRAN